MSKELFLPTWAGSTVNKSLLWVIRERRAKHILLLTVNLKPPVNASVAKTSLVPSSYESVFKISTFTIKLAPLRKMVQVSYSESTTMMTLTITKIKGLAILRNAIHTGLTVDSANQTEKKTSDRKPVSTINIPLKFSTGWKQKSTKKCTTAILNIKSWTSNQTTYSMSNSAVWGCKHIIPRYQLFYYKLTVG
jgi:hypothetical protein